MSELEPLPSTLHFGVDFALANPAADGYLAAHSLRMPQPIDLKVMPPAYRGRDLGGRPWYQGFYALEAHFNWKTWDQLEALFAYYIVGHDSAAKVTVDFFNPFTGGYEKMTGWMHEPEVHQAAARLYLDVIVRFSHLE